MRSSKSANLRAITLSRVDSYLTNVGILLTLNQVARTGLWLSGQ